MQAYANKLKSGNTSAEPPKGGVVVSDIVEAKKRDDALEVELEQAREGLSVARQQLQERIAELESVTTQREFALAASSKAEQTLENDRRQHLLREQQLSSEIEKLQIQLRLASNHSSSNNHNDDNNNGNNSNNNEASTFNNAKFLEELSAVSEKLSEAKGQLLEAAEERRVIERRHAEELAVEKAKREAVESEMTNLREQIRQLEAWRDTQETRKARLFRPLKSGAKGPPQAFAEKLDHTELRKGLKSVSAEKKLW